VNFNPFKGTSNTSLNQRNCNPCQKFTEFLIVYFMLKLLRETNHQRILVAVLDKTSDVVWKSTRIKPFEAFFRVYEFDYRYFILQMRTCLPLGFNTVKRMFDRETNRYPCHPYASCLQIEILAWIIFTLCSPKTKHDWLVLNLLIYKWTCQVKAVAKKKKQSHSKNSTPNSQKTSKRSQTTRELLWSSRLLI
jgi:hypothetical protein